METLQNVHASAVSACPSLAINTYNSGATYDTCCTNSYFLLKLDFVLIKM